MRHSGEYVEFVACRLTRTQRAKLLQMAGATGADLSGVIRPLVDGAKLQPVSQLQAMPPDSWGQEVPG